MGEFWGQVIEKIPLKEKQQVLLIGPAGPFEQKGKV